MIGIALLGAGRVARVHAQGLAAEGGKPVTVFVKNNCEVTWNA